MSNPTLNLIFEKLGSSDKDFRYMATSDLLQELKKDTIRMDAETEKKICRVVLQQMQDISGDISNLGIKCLGALVPKIQDAQIGDVSDILCKKLLSDKKVDMEKRDVASIGLKTVIAEIHSGPAGHVLVKRVAPRLISSLPSTDTELVIECLDIIRDLVTKFGHLLEEMAGDLQSALTPKLEEERGAVRKRAIQCLGVLAIHMADNPLDNLCEFLVMGVSINSGSSEIASSFIQAIGCISQTVGYRFGKHLSPAVPLIIEKMSEAGEEEGDIMEMGLHALESFVSRCPAQVKGLLDKILDTALMYLRHDPNFAEDMSHEEEDAMDYEEEEEDEYSDEYTDDDDNSWKVRRAAAHCLSAIFINNPDQITGLYPKAAPELMKRFCEREENVRRDVFNAFVDLLKQINRMSKHLGEDQQQRVLGDNLPLLMKSLSKQLKEKSMKTRIGAFQVLCELASTTPKALAEYSGLFVEGVRRALQEKTGQSDLKIEALLFLKLSMLDSVPLAYQPHLMVLSGPIFANVQERYYKVTAEALRVCRGMVHVIRPDVSQPVLESSIPLVVSLFDAAMARLGAQDQDQEVKECAIKCIAVAVKHLGDILPEKVQEILHILLDRAKSETTRLTTVKAINTIAQSELNIDLESILEPAVVHLTDFLRKANMVLRQASLAALESLCARLGSLLSQSVVERIIMEAAILVDDGNLHLAAQSLTLLQTLLRVQPNSAAEVADIGIPKAMELVMSTLLQGSALEALRSFFAAVARSTGTNSRFADLFNALMSEGMKSTGKVQQLSVAQCMASLCCDGQPEEIPVTVSKLMAAYQQVAGSQRLILFCLGELGRRTDLSRYGDIEALILSSMNDPVEDNKAAASFALGAITFGNLDNYLGSLLNKVRHNIGSPKQLYLLLQALNEVIRSIEKERGAKFSNGDLEEILDVLLTCSESEEECRNVVAECLGHLAVIHPNAVFQVLSVKVAADSPAMRYTVITSVKYTVLDRESSTDPMLHAVLPKYLRLVNDEDRHVRKAAVQVLSSVLTHKVALVEEHLVEVLPMLYMQTVKRKDLVRILDLGPFKLEVDDGLELRKASFECMDLLLDSCPKQLDTSEFAQHLLDGLGDDADIRLLCHPMLSKLCAMAETEVVSKLDKFVEPLQKTLNEKTKKDAVKHEKDRHEDMLRSCLRCVVVLSQLPAATSNTAFKRFMDVTVQKGEMKSRFMDLEKEKAEAEGKATALEVGRQTGGGILHPLNQSRSLGTAYS